MIVLGFETSCDETGVAVYDTGRRVVAHALHSQVAMHAEYGGVVPELASRDHVRRLVPLVRRVLTDADVRLQDLDGVAYTQGPGLAGALLVGASVAAALGYGLGIPVIGVHHLEGHLLSPLLSARSPEFPFVALLVSGGHTQLMRVDGIGRYALLGETLDDAAGEAFDKTAQLLGLGYPGGPAISRLAETGDVRRFRLPRPMLASGGFDFSFSGLKTAVRELVAQAPADPQSRADVAAAFQAAVVDVLATKSLAAVAHAGLDRLVIAGGVGANRELRSVLEARATGRGVALYYPEPELCTDNGAMIALAGALRLTAGERAAIAPGFTVRPRWDLATLEAPC
jgi:N6-L-threonylcarbamoyladenine synthase